MVSYQDGQDAGPRAAAEIVGTAKKLEVAVAKHGLSFTDRRALVNRLQVLVDDVARISYHVGDGLVLEIDAKDKQKRRVGQTIRKVNYHVIRQHVTSENQDTQHPIPYFGRVVLKETAVLMKHDDLLPIPCKSGHGPTMYLDGSNFTNPNRSDYCIAWHIKTLGNEKKGKNKSSDADILTHEWTSKDLAVSLPVSGGADKSFIYSLPCLMDAKEEGAKHLGKCWRPDADWDQDHNAADEAATTEAAGKKGPRGKKPFVFA